MNLDGSRISMQYSVPRDQKAYEQSKLLTDWICAKVTVSFPLRKSYQYINFSVEFKIFVAEKHVSNAVDPRLSMTRPTLIHQMKSAPTPPTVRYPDNVSITLMNIVSAVLLSGLDTLTTEDSVLGVLGPVTKLPLKNVKIGRDPPTGMSRGVCYVEMNSVVDAMFLHNQLIASPPCIDGRVVEVSYHKQSGAVQVVSSSGQHQAAALSALEAAQWSNKSGQQTRDKWSEEELGKMALYSANLYAKNDEEQAYYVEYYKKFYSEGGDTSAAEVALGEREGGAARVDKKVEKEQSSVVVGGVEYKKYPAPDTSKYQYDETSGYYYDPVSTLYYDANSQYYYNSKDSKFYYWDGHHETFLPAPNNGETAKTTKVDEKQSKKEELKSAKKIQKDMEKWMKKNNKKDQSKMAESSSQDSVGGNGKGTEDIAFNLLQRKEEGGLAGLAGYASDEDDADKTGAAGADMSIAELKLTDWSDLKCLLCQRGFKSRDQLTKHNTMSDLHSNNLVKWRSEFSETVDTQEIQYRDRAKERRKKFGDDDKPPPNRYREKFMKALDHSSAGGADLASAPKVGDSNIGNKMLQKMGWKDGQGLGKSNQGRTEIILAQQRTQGSGLGTQQSAGNPNDCYKEKARKTLWSRYNDAQ